MPTREGRLALTAPELRQFFLFCKDFFINKKTWNRCGQKNLFLKIPKILDISGIILDFLWFLNQLLLKNQNKVGYIQHLAHLIPTICPQGARSPPGKELIPISKSRMTFERTG